MRMQRPSDFVWSREDRATFIKWRRGVLIVYGAISLIAFAATVAIWLMEK